MTWSYIIVKFVFQAIIFIVPIACLDAAHHLLVSLPWNEQATRVGKKPIRRMLAIISIKCGSIRRAIGIVLQTKF